MSILATAVAAGGAWVGAADEQEPQHSRPNILILQPDQHRGTIASHAGDDQIETPNLDRLAAQGIRFTHAASNSPVCSPFRATMQTGLYWHTHGVVKNNVRLDYDHVTIAEIFRDAGYATGYVGKWHLDGGKPEVRPGGFIAPGEARQGWEDWHGYEIGQEFFDVWTFDDDGRKVRVEGYDWEPTWHTDLALDFARRHSEAGQPWLYYVSYGPPHKPAQCPEEYLDRFPPEAFRLPADVADTSELRRVWQMYYAQVTAIDGEVGRILEGLDDLGIADNTIIVYTSDHGDLLGSSGKVRGKSAPHPDAFRIPFIVRWPQRIAPGQVRDVLISSVDFVPTLLDLAGLAVPEHMQGVSMAGWALRGKGPQQDGVYLGLYGGGLYGLFQGWRAVWDGTRVITDEDSDIVRSWGEKTADPWRDRTPTTLLFVVVGLIAIGLLLMLRRVRRMLQRAAS